MTAENASSKADTHSRLSGKTKLVKDRLISAERHSVGNNGNNSSASAQIRGLRMAMAQNWKTICAHNVGHLSNLTTQY